MAQSTDITLANQSGLAFRTELNTILAALSSLQSGSSAPSTTNAYQLWIDTSSSPAQLKIRNGANSAWIVVSSDVTATNLGLAALSGATFTGDVTMNAQSDVRFADSDSSNYVALQGAATIGSNVTFTLPSSDGSNGQVLQTNGSGVLSFASTSGAVTSVGGQTGAVTYATSWAVGTGATAATNTDLDVSGTYAGNVVAVSALDIDCSTGNYFTKSISADSTFTFSNIPSSRAFAFTVEIDVTGDRTISWPSSVSFPSATAPTLTSGKTHLFFFVTNDGGTSFRAASLVDYTT
tara:strand:+ start:9973 stop:10851 length:879 start_codon:yes stop_codon:yes gene_type:complete